MGGKLFQNEGRFWELDVKLYWNRRTWTNSERSNGTAVLRKYEETLTDDSIGAKRPSGSDKRKKDRFRAKNGKKDRRRKVKCYNGA